MIFPLDRLLIEHRKHYRTGTLDDFTDWFKRSGFGDMLENPYLKSGATDSVSLGGKRPDLSSMQSFRYENARPGPAELAFQVDISRGANNVKKLFENFVRCTCHTHLTGDFRKYGAFFAANYTGAGFVVFDGAGTCLLLGAMFQALSRNIFGENVALHYSFTAHRELTHVFATWNGYFVDPDQKTWVPFDEVERSALFGYLFQQLGVSAYQVYLAIPHAQRELLFTHMSRDYFGFYDGSRTQYMYQADQSVDTVGAYFKQAREDHCSDLDIYAADFPWKAKFRALAEARDIQIPYFLSGISRPIQFEIPAGGSFEVGLHEKLPQEIEMLSSIFLGRVPGTLSFPVGATGAEIKVPEMPWMIFFSADTEQVSVNGTVAFPPLSSCGRYRVLGAGMIEKMLDPSLDNKIFRFGADSAGRTLAVVIPVNAFALASGLIDLKLQREEDFKISGRVRR